MRITKVRYGITRPGSEPYTSDRIDVEIELEGDETFADGLSEAKRRCMLGIGAITQKQIDEAKELLRNFG